MAKITTSRPVSPEVAKRRMRIAMLCFFLVLLVPLVILFHRSYRQLENESYYQYRTMSEGVVAQIYQRVFDFLKPEEDREFEEYQFFKSMGPAPGVLQLSPLSTLPPQSMFPGLVGYFQIDPAGNLTTPFLPAEDERKVHWAALGISPQSLMHRKALNTRIRRSLQRMQILNQPGTEPAPTIAAAVPEGASGTPQASKLGEELPPKENKEPKTASNEKLSDLNLDSTLMIEQEQTKGTVIFKGNVVSQLEARFKKRVIMTPPVSDTLTKQEEREELKDHLTISPSAPAITVSSIFGSRQIPNASISERVKPSLIPSLPGSSFPSSKSPLGFSLPSTVGANALENDMDPLQVAYSDEGVIAFYRKVWRGGQRLVQGFIVNSDLFFKTTIDSTFYNSPISRESSLIIGKDGRLVRKLDPRLTEATPLGPGETSGERDRARKGNIVLLKSNLMQPLNGLELWFTVPSIPKGPGYMLVMLLGVVLFLVFVFGFYGVYRLVAEQIEIAAQRSDFVSAVSHELKTPLTSIRMYGEMLRSGWVEEPEKQKKYFDFIFFESERLSRLIANVLQLSKVSKQEAPLAMKEFKVKALLDSVKSKIATQIEASGFDFQLQCEDSIEESLIKVDEDAFTQIMINLIDNAIKFSAKAEKKRIEVSARKVGNGVSFNVRDYGPGVPKDQVKRVFDLFYRVENELTRTTPGTGIGLALVSQLSERMNAHVDLENKDVGVEFKVRFELSNSKSTG